MQLVEITRSDMYAMDV